MTIFDDIRTKADEILNAATSAEGMYITASSDLETALTTIDTLVGERNAARQERDAARSLAQLLQVQLDECRAGHPDPDPDPDPDPVALKRIGMSATANEWDLRISQVGPGVTARRLFVQNLSPNGLDKEAELRDCRAKGLLPVISYKTFGAWTTQWAQSCASFLDSLDMEILVVFNHEPHGDMSPGQFTTMQAQLTPIFQRGKLKVGPLLNGWLLDRRRADFESYLTDELLETWDFAGMDSYQSGTEAAPGDTFPGHRMPALLDVLADRGHPEKPIVVGEYNGWTAEAIRFSGEVWLSTPSLYAALMFNSSTGGKGKILAGDRLDAFKGTLQDDRAAK